MFVSSKRTLTSQSPAFELLESRRLLTAVSLTFAGGAGGLADSGFTGVLHSDNGGTFIANNVSVSGDQLHVTSTPGDLLGSLNDQDDALDVSLDASQDFIVQTRITTFRFRRRSQSAGIFVAANEDNYVKFVVGDFGSTGLQLGSEVGGTFSAAAVPALNLASIQTLDLRLIGDSETHQLTAQYRVNSSSNSAWVTYGQVTNAKVFRSTAKAGVLTTNHGTKKTVSVAFASFSATDQGADQEAPGKPAPGPALTAETNVDATPLLTNQVSPQVAVNPTNPQNIVMVSQAAANQTAIPVSYSFNGGATWTLGYITGALDGLPGSNPRVDARLAFDQFGNLYVVYEVAANSNEIRMVVARSNNGGVSFTSASTAVGSAGSNVDYPSIAAGVDAANPSRQAVWVTYTDYANPNDLQVKAVYAISTGLGKLSSFSAPLLVSRSSQGDLANVTVGPEGQVAVAYEADDTQTGPDRVFVSVDANGSAGTFGADTLAARINIGPYTPIPAQPDRTIFASVQVAFDNSDDSTRGRLYLVYTDAAAVGSADTNIELRYSDNLGSTFSSALRVNDDKTSKSQFLPALAVDPDNGVVGISWLDARNSPHNNTVQEYATVSVNHGVSVVPNVLVSAGTSNQAWVASSDPLNFGDVTGAAFSGGKLIAAWADDSNGTNFDILTAAVTINSSAFAS